MTYIIILEPGAVQDLLSIKEFITQEGSKYRASHFIGELKKSIASLSEMPMRCRQSLYLEAENTRDLIYKGYTIVFQIREDYVYVLAIFRQKAY